jgi:hypothetical protein
MAWLRGLALFGLLVLVPFAVEQFFGRRPRLQAGSYGSAREWIPSWWHDLLSYTPAAIILLVLVVLLVLLLINYPQTYKLSEYLTLAERELNALLRGWGGGYSNRKDVVKERADWLSMIPGTPEVYKQFFELNQEDLKSGGPQGGAMGKARFTAFLLREIYEGNVRNAQIKILNELKSGGKPHIAAGIREIVDYDEIEKTKELPKNYIGYFPMILTVKLHHHPKHIIMVRTDKTVAENWAVLNELNQQLRPLPT